MNLEESKKLLRYLAGIDGRKVTNDAAHATHKLFRDYDLVDAMEAAERTIERNPEDPYVSLQKIRSLLDSARPAARPECRHGVPHGSACYDCTHPGQPGGPTPAQGTIQADEVERVIAGGWRDLADPDETARLARSNRTHGVVHPGETTCPWGHTIDHDIVTARRRARRLPTCQDCVA